jgi:hypothetical protein
MKPLNPYLKFKIRPILFILEIIIILPLIILSFNNPIIFSNPIVGAGSFPCVPAKNNIVGPGFSPSIITIGSNLFMRSVKI